MRTAKEMRRLDAPVFWGAYSPFGSLTGAAIILLSSVRLSFAIFTAGAFVWVYGLTGLCICAADRFMPQKGKKAVYLFLSSFTGLLWLFIFSFADPLLVRQCYLYVLLVPIALAASGLTGELAALDLIEAVPRCILEALCPALLSLGLALIREPLGLGTLSFPGGPLGIFETANPGEDGFFPLRIFSVSGGGLILFGYAASLYRFMRTRVMSYGEDES